MEFEQDISQCWQYEAVNYNDHLITCVYVQKNHSKRNCDNNVFEAVDITSCTCNHRNFIFHDWMCQITLSYTYICVHIALLYTMPSNFLNYTATHYCSARHQSFHGPQSQSKWDSSEEYSQYQLQGQRYSSFWPRERHCEQLLCCLFCKHCPPRNMNWSLCIQQQNHCYRTMLLQRCKKIFCRTAAAINRW